MTKTREYLAQRAQLQRNLRKKLAIQRQAARRLQISQTLVQTRAIIENREFADLLLSQKITSVPSCICRYVGPSAEIISDHEIADAVLIFVVAWKFLFPLISNANIADFLERSYPGFIAGLKDTFITLVMDGPFPDMRRTPIRPAHFG
ncbi:MAG: hypothetical protein J0I29_14270 [Rhizobiales bacterium]|nr:hypothetical protein [Hyphomicrobiales bacterium]